MGSEHRGSPLARYLLLAYGLLVIYASLHPFSGWSAAGVDPFAFVTAALPRRALRFDVFSNVLGYVPLGFLAVLALYPSRAARAVAAASAGAIALSFLMETLQSYLPSRTPSNVDFAANSAGAIAGALLAALSAERLLQERGLKVLRHRVFRSGRRVDAGLVLLGLWLLLQIDPQSLLFGAGDLRGLFQEPGAELHPAEVFIRAEALVGGANAVAIGMLTALLGAPGEPLRRLYVGLVLVALAVRALAFGVFFGTEDAFNWLTPGAYFGVASGALLVLAAMALPRPVQLVLCALALMAGAVVVNIAPANPYLAESLSTWRHGYFEHFIGLTRFLSAVWPFLALVYVVSLANQRELAPPL